MIPLAINIKRYFSLQEFAVVFLAIVVSVSAGVGVFVCLKKEVVINDNGKQIVAKTMKTTVKEVLEQNRITLTSDDYISLGLDSRLQRIKKNEINIKRAVPINITADGQQTRLMTYRDTVGEALANSSIKLSEQDKLDGAALEDNIVRDVSFRIVRVSENEATEEIPIPFNVVNRENSRMDKGSEKVVREGKEGTVQKIYRVLFEDGKEVGRELAKQAIIANPIDKIVEFGTVLNHKTARGDTIRYSKVLDMRSTAYTASFADTGKYPGDPYFGITATGVRAKKGIIAVDPRVIPLGTRVYVEVAGNTPDYGYAVAGDTGGAIKNDLIDLYFDEQYTVNTWGTKRVKVYFLID